MRSNIVDVVAKNIRLAVRWLGRRQRKRKSDESRWEKRAAC